MLTVALFRGCMFSASALVLCTAFAPVLCAALCAKEEAAFYVSPGGNDAWSGTKAEANEKRSDGPFATLTAARDAIRKLKEQGPLTRPVRVLLRGGRYELAEPLVLSPEDSGTKECPIIYAACPGEKPVLSGGKRITGWKPGEGGLKAGGTPAVRMWTAELPEAKDGKWSFRQLVVNGECRFRPRLPKEGFFFVSSLAGVDFKVKYDTPIQKFEFKPGDIRANWTNLEDVEIVALHFWVDTHLPIESVDEAANTVTLARKSRRKLTDDYTNKGARYYVDNVFEALQTPGEWYLNRQTGVLYYLPKPGEDMSKAEVIAPRTPSLLRLEGKPEAGQFVEHVEFHGLAFSDSAWELGPKDAGDAQAAGSVPGALYAKGARHCAVRQCRLEHLGSYGLELAQGCSDNQITGNEIARLAAGGIRISGGDAAAPEKLRTGNNVVADNEIHHLGQIFHSGIGVLSQHSAGNTIAHNHIHHLYYTGISVGWVWGYRPSVSRDNKIEFNHIHDIGQKLLSDMGGIYTLGVSPGTVVRNNLIHDVDSWGYGGWGIYTDEGSTGILIENNVVYRTKSGGFHQHYGKENTVRNNVFALAREEQIVRSREEPHISFTFEHNIVYHKEGQLLSKKWQDDKFKLDYNVYFNAASKPVTFPGALGLADWQKRGFDAHSLVADPLFVDPDKGNFALKPDSPALSLGFQPIDMSGVGPRKTGTADERR